MLVVDYNRYFVRTALSGSVERGVVLRIYYRSTSDKFYVRNVDYISAIHLLANLSGVPLHLLRSVRVVSSRQDLMSGDERDVVIFPVGFMTSVRPNVPGYVTIPTVVCRGLHHVSEVAVAWGKCSSG